MALKHNSALLLAALLSLMSALSHAAPTINTSPSSITPAYGTSAVLSASVTAEPGATFAWMRDGTTPIINGGRYSGAGTATLTITGANSADNGSYELTVTDGTGSASTTPATINATQTPGSLDPAYTGAGANGGSTTIYTNKVLHLPDGRTLLAVSNQFNGVTTPLTTATSNLVVMAANGTVSHPAGSIFNGEVTCLFRTGDGKILVGGNFTTHIVTVGNINTNRTRVARLNADLTLDTTFVPTGPSAKPSVIFADSYGRIYLGGNFFNYDGILGFQYLVRLKDNGTLDQSFKPLLDGTVNGVAIQKDGKFIVGGIFISRGAFPSTPVAGLLRFNADGTIDTGYTPALPGSSTNQNGLALDDADNLYLARSNPNVSITKLQPDGTAVAGFNFALTPDAPLSVLASQPGGKLAMGGMFTTPTNRLFRINTGDGSPDTSFGITTGITITSGTPEIYGLSSDAIGRLWVTGKTFSHYNGSASNRFAVIQGSAGPTLAFTAEPTGGIVNQGGSVTLTAHATGNNGFTHLWHRNGSPLSNGGRFSGVDTNALTIANLEQGDEAAYTLVVSSPGASSITSRAARLDVLGVPEITLDPVNQTVDFGGTVTLTAAAIGATTLTYEWRYNGTPLSNGTGVSGANTDTLVLTNVDFNDAGHYILKVTNGLGDDFSAPAILTVQKRPGAKVGGNLPTFVGVGYGGYVSSILPLSDGSYIVGGNFSRVTINGVDTNRKGLARIKADGTLDMTFPTVNSTNRPSVEAIVKDDAGRIFIGGDFTSVVVGVTETPRLRVARLTPVFALDTAFNTSTVGPDKIVNALATSGDGSVYIGGEFLNIGTTAIRYIAKLNTSGARDGGFSNTIPANETNKYVRSIFRHTDGTLYVGSNVSNWSSSVMPGFNLSSLVKLSASGSRVSAFNPFPFASGFFGASINAVIRLSDGSLFAGGNPLATLKRFNGTSGADLGLTLPGHFIQTFALHQQKDGKLLSGSHSVLKRTDTSLVPDAGFDIGGGFDNYIRAITTDSAGRIFVGGEFGNFNGQPCNRFVILNGGDLDSRSQPKPGQTITFPDIADRAFVPGNVVANTVTITLPTSSSSLPVTTVVTSGPATLTGNKLTITGAGTVILTATQAGNDDFSAASIAESFQVSKASQTLTFEPMSDRPAGSAPFLLTASLSSGLPVVYSIVNGPATVNGNVLTLTGATGFVSIQASHPGNADFLPAAPDLSRSFQVFAGTAAPLPQTIIFNPLPPRSANEPAFSISASSTSGLPVTLAVTSGGTIASIAGNLVTLSGLAGNVTITATQAGNANFLSAKAVTQTFKVNAAATALTLTNLIQTYNGTPRSIGVVGGTADTIYYTVNKVKGTTPPIAAGSYAVEAVSGTGPTAIKKAGTLVINKAPLLVVADDERRFVGQPNPVLTFAYSGFLLSDNPANSLTKVPTVSTKATPTSPGGNYPITPAGGASNNYNLVLVNGNMKVDTFAGQYEALLMAPVTFKTIGKIEITVLANSIGFTGKMTTSKETTAVPFKGNLSPDFISKTATATVTALMGKAPSINNYSFEIALVLGDDAGAIVRRAVNAPPASGDFFGFNNHVRQLQFPTGTPAVPYAGAHTVLFSPTIHTTGSTLPLPQGYGHATGVIDAKGKLTLAGALADGTKITASLFPDIDAGYRLYLVPYAGRLDSFVAAELPLDDHPDLLGRKYLPESTATFEWSKAAKTADANYRDGFQETSGSLLFDPWLPPLAAKTPNPAITLPQRLVLGGSGEIAVYYNGLPNSLTFPGLAETANIDTTGKVTTPAPNSRAWKMTITAATGLFTASHTVLDGTKSVTVNYVGALRQAPSAEAAPHFLGAGFGIIPQLTGQTGGTLSSSLFFEQPAALPD